MTRHGKVVAASIALAFVAAIAWIGWEFRPFMPGGKTVYLASAHMDDFDFQVWQMKNGVFDSEPFTTWLWARRSGHRWTPYQLEFEDLYRPKITLRKNGENVDVMYGSEKFGTFDESTQTFTRASNGLSYRGAEVNEDPPGTR